LSRRRPYNNSQVKGRPKEVAYRLVYRVYGIVGGAAKLDIIYEFVKRLKRPLRKRAI